MNPVKTFRTFARYNAWMNDKLYGAAETLTDEQRKEDRGAFFSSVHGTLNHILTGDLVWLERFQVSGASALADVPVSLLEPFRGLDAELFEDFAELRIARDAVDEMILAWCDRDLTDGWLDDILVFKTKSNPNVSRELPAGLCVTHFFNHQTHHRGQVTTLLSQCGIDPGVTDLMAMPGAIPKQT
jgi:uncharacterized damage-inducible protein DinB